MWIYPIAGENKVDLFFNITKLVEVMEFQLGYFKS